MNTAATEGFARAENFEIDHPDEYGRFLLRDRREILFHLNLLTKRGNLVTAYLDGGPGFFLTSILVVDDDHDQVILDAAQEETLNQQAAQAEQITLVTAHEKVKIQIRVGSARKTISQGHPALAVKFPEKMLRLQRREFFRLEPPLAHPLFCELCVTSAQGEQRQFTLNVADISGGGLSITIPSEGMVVEPDMEFGNCRLMLPETGAIVTSLRVRNLFRITNRDGSITLRAGCEFTHLSSAMASTIQRYILKVERERNARERIR